MKKYYFEEISRYGMKRAPPFEFRANGDSYAKKKAQHLRINLNSLIYLGKDIDQQGHVIPLYFKVECGEWQDYTI